uniref:Uncharacterized protein n=1 Tax=Opuntia streptacantha TaxID=393608 RepID=A0A7C9CEG3_OPUST
MCLLSWKTCTYSTLDEFCLLGSWSCTTLLVEDRVLPLWFDPNFHERLGLPSSTESSREFFHHALLPYSSIMVAGFFDFPPIAFFKPIRMRTAKPHNRQEAENEWKGDCRCDQGTKKSYLIKGKRQNIWIGKSQIKSTDVGA